MQASRREDDADAPGVILCTVARQRQARGTSPTTCASRPPAVPGRSPQPRAGARMTASRSPEQDYAPPNDWRLARRPLALLEAFHDAATFRRAEALGVRAGWHCLGGRRRSRLGRTLAGRAGGTDRQRTGRRSRRPPDGESPRRLRPGEPCSPLVRARGGRNRRPLHSAVQVAVTPAALRAGPLRRLRRARRRPSPSAR
jgi:hypothetical protein